MPHVSIADIKLYYEMFGRGEPVLFIHGLGSSGRDWHNQVEFFSKHYQVITVDLRGHGQSSKRAGPFSMLLFAADIVDLITTLGIKPCHVVGISLGGMIAFQLAASRPDLFRSMVIVNSRPEFIIRTFTEYVQLWQRDLVARLLGMRTVGKMVSKKLFPKLEQEVLRKELVQHWAENDSRAYRGSMHAMVGWSAVGQLGSMDISTLVIAAEEDYTPLSYKEAYVTQMPQADMVVIPDSRHATPLDRPDMFNKTVLKFLSRQTPPVIEESESEEEQTFITYQTELDALNGGH
jgi:pimeloyl-ACP methyl ester carboxylesterase